MDAHASLATDLNDAWVGIIKMFEISLPEIKVSEKEGVCMPSSCFRLSLYRDEPNDASND